MKTKIALIIGILCSMIMIGYSIYQGGNVYEAKQKYSRDLETARQKALLYGGTVQKTSGLTPYAVKTRTAGKITLVLSLVLLTASVLAMRFFKPVKGLFVFHIIGIVILFVSLVFSVAMIISTGGATFDETFVIWTLFGTISLVLYGISMIKLPKMNQQFI